MNLMDFGFQHSNLFEHMPIFDEITYLGHREGKVRQYKATREDQECHVLSLNFIKKDEKILWEAVEDFIKRSTINSSTALHGVYVFDLLTIDIHKEIKTFNHNELTTMIINVARHLAPGQTKMIKYSSSFGILRKLIHEDWGKITFKTSVEVFKDKPEYLDLLIKSLLKDFQFPRNPVILLLNDLSQDPIFDDKNENQQVRLKKRMEKLIPTSIDFIPEVYVTDNKSTRELLSLSNIL